jgi:subtilase family serine protease
MKYGKHLAAVALGLVCAAQMYSTHTALALDKAAIGAQADPTETVTFEVYLPIQHPDQLDALLVQLHDPNSALYHQWLTPAQFNTRFGPDAGTVAAVRKEIEAFGLTAKPLSPRFLSVSGSARGVEQLLSTRLNQGTYANGAKTIVATGQISLPTAMASANAQVSGLSGVIHMRPNSHRAALPANRTSPVGGYWFDDLKQAYSFPSFLSFAGKGANIGVLMSSDFRLSDMNLYFSHEKLKTPSFSEVKINGGAPFDLNSGATFEAALDLQQTGGMAPQASIRLYNIPDLSDANIQAALVIIDEDNREDVVNMSFSGPELLFAPSYNGGQDFRGILRAEDELFAQGNAQGITFVGSSGDTGAKTVPALACFAPGATSKCGGFVPSAEFPASSPHVTGVGGTNLITRHTSGSLDSTYVREAAYGDPLTVDIDFGTPAQGSFWGSGGGNSIVFGKPAYQKLVTTGSTARTVPDLSLQMGGCPQGAVTPCAPNRSFVITIVGGQAVGLIGTSISSPDFAGLTALKVQRLGGRQGNENFAIYALAAKQAQNPSAPLVFHRNIPGFNGLFSAVGNYNRVVGVGTVYGKNFILAPTVPVAGVPQTPTNP